MNIFNLLNNFFKVNESEKVSPSATKLYFFLIYEANNSYWEGPLMLSVRKLASFLSFSKNTVCKSLKELEDRELIVCYSQGNDKESLCSTFWFPDLQLNESKEVYDKGVRYNVHSGKKSSKYAKFF